MGHDQVSAVFDSGLSGVISSIALGDKGNLHQLAHHWLNLLGPLGHLCAFLFGRWGNPQPQRVAQCAYSQVDLAAPDVPAAAGLPASSQVRRNQRTFSFTGITQVCFSFHPFSASTLFN